MALKLMKDESGVNMLVEYVLNFAIMLILFTIVLLTYQSLMTQSNNTLTHEELKIVANDVANKITTFDSIISSTEAQGGPNINGLTQTFETLPQISGSTYYIDIHSNAGGGYVEVHTSDTNVLPVRADFATDHPVNSKTIPSSSLSHSISYSKNSPTIEVK